MDSSVPHPPRHLAPQLPVPQPLGDAGPLREVVEALHHAAVGAPDGLTVLVNWARRSVPGADHVSFTLLRDGRPTTPAAAGPAALALDQAQFDDDAGGPCLDAARTRRTVDMPDALLETRWPGYVRAARASGVRASLSVPVPPPADPAPEALPQAALNFYATAPGALGAPSRRAAEAVAGVATAVLAEPARLAAVADRLARAAADGATVRAACQVLAARDGSAAKALALLVAEAERTGRPLAEVARAALARDPGAPA